MPNRHLLQNLLYAFVVVILVGICTYSVYFISVNTVLAKRVLPRVHAGDLDLSLLTEQDMQTTLTQQLVSRLPQVLSVNIDGYDYEVPIAKLDIKVSTEPLQYGKGSDMLKVAREAVGLLSSPNLELTYSLNPQAVIDLIPLKLNGTKPAQIQNGVIENCDTGEFSVQINHKVLAIKVKQSLDTASPLQTSLADISLVPETAQILGYCAQYHQQIATLNTATVNLGMTPNSLFVFKVNDARQAYWAIKDQALLEQQLRYQTSSLNVPAQEGKYETTRDAILLFEPYVVGKRMNLESTIQGIDTWLSAPSGEMPIVYDEIQPKVLTLGKKVLDFTKHLAAGKTRIDIVRDGHPNWVLPYAQYGLEDIQHMVIDAHKEFSFIDTIKPQPGGWTQEGRPIGAGICNSSTTLFRAALESGFPVTDRSYHPHFIDSYIWGYPMNLVDAAYLTEPRVDMKFINDLDYPVLLKFSYERPGDGWQYHTLDVYTSSQAQDRKVVIDNFRKWNAQSEHRYEGSFDRKVYDNGNLVRSDNFYSKYI